MTKEEDEDMTAHLLRLAGPRPAVPAERVERIRHAVTATWRAELRRHRLRRRLVTGAAVLAAAAALVVAIRLAAPPKVEAPSPKTNSAVVERVEGATPVLSAGRRLSIGEWIETAPDSRVALRIGDRTSMRFDVSTRARLLDAKTIELERGAIYLDTGAEPVAFEVHTRLGVARDIGTQFEVRLIHDSLRVRVRSGQVELRSPTTTTSVGAGSEVTFAGDHAATREIPTFGPEWQWASQLATPFDIEGQPLAAFLEHISREQGWILRYSDAELAGNARKIVLHGSVYGLQPEVAVTVVLRTSNLAWEIRDGELMVSRSTGRD